MLNFFRRFSQNAAKHQTKLNNSLVGIKKKKGNLSIEREGDLIKAFEYRKERFSESTTLAHPLNNVHLAIMVSASDNAVGGVLQKYVCNHWQPPLEQFKAIIRNSPNTLLLETHFSKPPVITSEYMITWEVSIGQPRLHIPAAFCKEIFERYHRTSHSGT
ncbi:hypothetical protein TNCV_3878681 [Trichonephila clavipes]|nr:hypothetical protein TNCV_3878681 [Trichonephila clavipes]